MLALIREGKDVVFGGEGNGGLIFPEHQFCRDGGMTAAMMVSLLQISGRTLSSLVDQLPPYYMVRGKIVTSTPDLLIDRVEQLFCGEKIDKTDGIRITRGKSWALIRPSGTEPFVRVIAESEDETMAESFYNEIVDMIEKEANC
jgi:phosphomannomutase/phosphoglucomutase